MSFSKQKRMFLLKCFTISISVVIGAIFAQMIMIGTVAILSVPILSNLPSIFSGIVFSIGVCLAILAGILSFRGIFRYLKGQINSEEGKGAGR